MSEAFNAAAHLIDRHSHSSLFVISIRIKEGHTWSALRTGTQVWKAWKGVSD